MVRKEGPQLSLIDLPGVTHNADQMSNIHEVHADQFFKEFQDGKDVC